MIVLNSLLMASECFFGGSLVLALALGLSHGKPASQRHLILTGAFAVLLALPLASLALPSHFVWYLAAPHTVVAQTVPQTVSAAPAAVPFFDLADLVLGLVALWAMGVIFVLSKAAYGGVALADLYRASVPYIPQGISPEKFRGLNWQLRLRTTPGDAGPITWGIFRPIVLLPKSSVTWSRARLEAVLLHEAAHVRRKDCLSRLIAVIASALYWPNPLVWMAARIMRRDGETAADDVVLSSGIKASAYAEHLVGLAQVFASSRPSYAGVSLAMAEPAMLDARVEAILHPSRCRKAASKKDVLKIAILGLTATAVMALARPSLAQAKPEPEDKPAVANTENLAKACPEKTNAMTDRKAARVASVAAEAPEEPADLPPAPPAPPANIVPPAPPAPPAVINPPAPPAPPSHFTVRWKTSDGIDKVWEGSGAAERAEADRALAAARAEHRRAIALEKEQIHKALATVHMQVNPADVMREHAADFAKAQADIANAQGEIAKAQATVHAALAKANISAVVAQAFDKAMVQAIKNARPAIEHALANTKVDVTVKVDSDEE